jgi:hypothetical protein
MSTNKYEKKNILSSFWKTAFHWEFPGFNSGWGAVSRARIFQFFSRPSPGDFIVIDHGKSLVV